ncbi:hypothetical protein MAR_028615 [Mya arenaria]|uniref:Transmembrane protein n=1 Tax=Mya arenaria TaxID=6604 RepID=A0ABY7DGV3_MYAAR|nr:uncharacterized protein LOC128243264 [Mya arenaria]WAQ95925.1 hypothetical protein MAR_028615 [Mya arenaria]
MIFLPAMETISQSERPHTSHIHSCRETAQRGRPDPTFKYSVPGGRRLWNQMLIGFVCAACLGMIMLILGSVFIGNAIKGNTSITVMLCVLGMVCGMIILVGTAILGRMLLTRKLRTADDGATQHRPEACLHTCSIIYTPSQDQLNGPVYQDPPPAYEMVIFPLHQAPTLDDGHFAGSIEVNEGSQRLVHPVMISPPKYSIAAAPLPEYGDPV